MHRCVQMDLQDQIYILFEAHKVINDTISLRGQVSGQALAGKRCDVPIEHNPSPLNKPRRHRIVDLRDVQRTRASDTVKATLHHSVGGGGGGLRGGAGRGGGGSGGLGYSSTRLQA